MNKHADMVKVPNQFLNFIRAKSEKLGEIVSPPCLSILPFPRQAKLKQAPKLCREMVYNFNNSKGDNNGGNQGLLDQTIQMESEVEAKSQPLYRLFQVLETNTDPTKVTAYMK